MKFDFSKSHKDLQNKSSISKLDILIKNSTYTTYRIDTVVKLLNKIDASLVKVLNSIELQKQVDEYFEDRPELEDK